MTVSVLIAAYNAAPFLGAALASVRSQTHPDWEVVVVEDGSDDGSAAIVGGFAASVSQNVRYEHAKANRGANIQPASQAKHDRRNHAVARADLAPDRDRR